MEDKHKILNTSLTWEVIEEDFTKIAGLPVKTGSQRSAVDCGSEKGHTSKVVKISFDWTTQNDKLPKTAIIKITNIEALEHTQESVKQLDFGFNVERATLMHDAEWNLYEESKQWPEFIELAKLPKYYLGQKFNFSGELYGYLIIENIEDATSLHMPDDRSIELVKEFVAVSAKLTAFSLKHPDAVKKMHSDVVEKLLTMYVTEKSIGGGLDALLEKLPQCKEAVDALRQLLPRYKDFATLKKAMSPCYERKLLCHGDSWGGNMLYQIDNNGKYKLHRLIDWQLVHLASPLEDLVKFVSSDMNPDEYEAKIESLLQFFYDILCKEAEGYELPWASLTELTEEYEKIACLNGLIHYPLTILFENALYDNYEGDDKDILVQRFRNRVQRNILRTVDLARKYKFI